MKQEEFAKIVGARKGLVQSWEQHRRIPSGAALKLLMVVERNPKIIEELRVLWPVGKTMLHTGHKFTAPTRI